MSKASKAILMGASCYLLYKNMQKKRKEKKASSTKQNSQTKKLYRFSREDFGPLPLMPLHYDLVFDMAPSRVRAISRQTYMYMAETPTKVLEFNSHDVEVEKVERYVKASLLGAPPQGIDSVGTDRDFVAHVASMQDPEALKFEVLKDQRKLLVHLDSPIEKGQEIVLRIVSECYPDDRMLEGIYYDYTPDGCPQTMITQCQQYGFQRIVPSVDRMASKTYYTTTIIADKRYSKLVTNGDLATGYYDPRTNEPIYADPAKALGQHDYEEVSSGTHKHPRHALRYYNHKVNMAPYLFFLGVGTYDSYQRRLEYPDGSEFILELMCLPDVVQPKHAADALTLLHDSVMHVYLCCGPEAYDHVQERARIQELTTEREALKAKKGPLVHKLSSTGSIVEEKENALSAQDEERLQAIRGELRELIKVWGETGYKYTGQIYREIAMENSNYGGMENVGNTTIVSSKLTPSNWLIDPGYVYMEGVKVHEYYHNINGSQVTGQSPFEIWLNEAVTVHVQRQREAAIFGHDYIRLRIVMYAFMPSVGPLASDRSPVSMAVEPAGFNTTHELVSAMTYSKAPEFVRMCELLLGKPRFVRALENYHQKYAYSNATSQQWINEMHALMPAETGVDVREMATGWLNRTGYPTLLIKAMDYDESAGTVTIDMQQTGWENHCEAERYPWIIPVDWALVSNGAVTHEGVFILSQASGRFVVSGVTSEPDFLSAARDWSFFGNVVNETATEAQLKLQAQMDPDAVNRYLAYRAVAEVEKARLIEALVADPDCELKVADTYLELYQAILDDDNLAMATKALFLAEAKSIPTRPDLGHRYGEIAAARVVLLQAVWDTYGTKVVECFTRSSAQGSVGTQKDGIGARSLMSVMLATIQAGLTCKRRSDDSPPNCGFTVNDLGKHAKVMLESDFMTSKMAGLKCLLSTPGILPADEQATIIEQTKAICSSHPIATMEWISAVSNCGSDNSVELIRTLIKEPFFKMQLAGHARTVARGWSAQRERALLSDLDFTVELFLTVGEVNQMSAYSLIAAFGDFKKFDDPHKARLVAALRKMQAGLDPKKQESLYNQLGVMLSNV